MIVFSFLDKGGLRVHCTALFCLKPFPVYYYKESQKIKRDKLLKVADLSSLIMPRSHSGYCTGLLAKRLLLQFLAFT